ncbi:cytidine deaminase, homotetrameric [Kipferlia bialata]|uniref:Cytidine deaminase n=1 Tax=Kipferlia bialata TaxID=797122 RepID=A0A391NLJ3_9EUKA|nr:cytidine deaminase, homotetrameric [Kipferlia bialata]|eukprot:g5504.t1
MSMTQEQKQALVNEAVEAGKNAYCIYSKYVVGACLQTPSGKYIRGCNVENASYGASICAERCAVFSAVAQGEREFDAVAVIGMGGAVPCGMCRQVLNEFNPKMVVLVGDLDGKIVLDTTLDYMLPHAFGPSNLLDLNLKE